MHSLSLFTSFYQHYHLSRECLYTYIFCVTIMIQAKTEELMQGRTNLEVAIIEKENQLKDLEV